MSPEPAASGLPTATTAALERQAGALLQQGRQQEAETLYRRLLAAGAASGAALVSYAVLCGRTGRTAAMLPLLRQALELQPDLAEAHLNLGVALRRQGDLAGAVAAYRRALQLRPQDADTYNNLALALQAQGDRSAALLAYRQALRLKPAFAAALANLATLLQEQGDLVGAVAALRRSIALEPGWSESHLNLGQALQAQGDLEAAMAAWRQALDIDSSRLQEPIYSLTNALLEHDQPAAAQRLAAWALAIWPQDARLHNNLGIALLRQGEIPAAIASHARAVELEPTLALLHINLAAAWQQQGDLSRAAACTAAAIALDPVLPQEHYQCGLLLAQQDQLEAALASFREAIRLQTDYADARLQLAMLLLLRGDYAEGWQAYDSRFETAIGADKLAATPVQALRWRGGPADAASQPLLVVCEQGNGDTFQFVRYLAVLSQAGHQLWLCAPRKLHRLLAASAIPAGLLAPDEVDAAGAQAWSPLLSLPGALGVSPAAPLISEAYLAPSAQRREHWRRILAAERRPLLCLNWQGNPNTEEGAPNLKGRSLPLEALAPLAAAFEGSLLSLQKGPGSEQLASCSFRDRFVACQEQLDAAWDFEETAAIIAACDLVITTDTAVAHLAGGMGHPTWLLLQQVPDWRWGLEGESTFWYPSLRLFRQRQRGDWAELIERVAAELGRRFRPAGQA